MHYILILCALFFYSLNSMEIEMENFSLPISSFLSEQSSVLRDMQIDTEELIPKSLFFNLLFPSHLTKRTLLELDSPKKMSSVIRSLNQTEKLNLLWAADYLEIDLLKKKLIKSIISFEDISKIDDSSLNKQNINDIRTGFLAKYSSQFGTLLKKSLNIIDYDLQASELAPSPDDGWCCMFGLSRQQTVLQKNALLVDLSCMNLKNHESPRWSPNEDDTQVLVGSSFGFYLFDAKNNKLVNKWKGESKIKRFEKIDYDSIKKTYVCHYEFADSHEDILMKLEPKKAKAHRIANDVKCFKKQESGRFLCILKHSLEIQLYHLDHQYTIAIGYPLLGKHLNALIDFDKHEHKLIVSHPDEKAKAINMETLLNLDTFISTKISSAQMGLLAKSFLFEKSVDLTQDKNLKTAFDNFPGELQKILTTQYRIRTQKVSRATQLKDKMLDFYAS